MVLNFFAQPTVAQQPHRYERNWLKSDLWSKQTWTYSANFSVDDLIPSSDSGASYRVQLVFDGIKMGAHVKVTGMQMGMTPRWISDKASSPSPVMG